MKHHHRLRYWLSICSALLAAALAFGRQPANLLTNGGFEKGTAAEMPGFTQLPWGQGGELDDAVRHSGTRSMRVSGHGGIRSDLIPYSGGRVRIVGWMKTENVVRGAKGWHKAALQLISYDDDRETVGHTDVALVEGTTDWQRYEKTCLLSGSVTYVAVHCHIWGEQARGTVWFDDIRLELLDKDLDLPRPHIDLDQAIVSVDFNERLGPFRHLWIGSDVSYMDRVVSDTQVNAMRHARQFGFRYIRMHDCVHNPGIYSETADGKPVYNWEKFDRRINAVVENGMWPVVVLESMPPEIATNDSGRNWANRYPPKGAEGYRKWQELIRRIVTHCADKWGDDIHNWYFEVWNEPNASGYFKGTLDEYLRIYDHAVAGATAAAPQIRIGGPGGAGTEWIRAFLNHCSQGQNDATGRTGCRVDFLSWHIYTVGVGLPVFDNLPLSLRTVRDILEDFEEYRQIPTLITEWGCASSPSPVHDRPYDAAFRVMAVRRFMDHDITLALPFALGAGPPHAHEGFQGSLAMFTKTTIPKPGFRAFELLHRMKGQRVKCDSSNAPIGGLACIGPAGQTAWIILYNLIENYKHEPYRTAVTIKLDGLAEDEWRCTKTMIAPGICDPYRVWKDMGAPEELTEQQRETLLEASELPDPQPVEVADDTIELTMPGFSLLQLHLTRG